MITFQPFIGGSLGSAPITTTGKITGGAFTEGTSPLPAIVAQTAAAGFALQNGTPSILTWTSPNDGQLHDFIVDTVLIVASAMTGGNVIVSYTIGGGVKNSTIWSPQGAGGTFPQAPYYAVCDPNTTVTLQQSVALTAGAATLYGALLAA